MDDELKARLERRIATSPEMQEQVGRTVRRLVTKLIDGDEPPAIEWVGLFPQCNPAKVIDLLFERQELRDEVQRLRTELARWV